MDAGRHLPNELPGEIVSLLHEIDNMTPVNRFNAVQQLLGDMQALIIQHKSDRVKADQLTAEATKRCFQLEDTLTKANAENAKLVRTVNHKDELLHEKAARCEATSMQVDDLVSRNNILSSAEYMLRRKLEACEASNETYLKEIEKLTAANDEAAREIITHKSQIEAHEGTIGELKEQKERVVRELQKVQKELEGALQTNSKLASAAVASRQRTLATLDEALMMNPNHFSDFDSVLFHDQTAV